MLLALDAGNTQTVAGLYDGPTLVEHWRTTTVRTHTADELALELRGLLELRGRELADPRRRTCPALSRARKSTI